MKRKELESRVKKMQLADAAKDLRRNLDLAFKREIDDYRTNPPINDTIFKENLQKAIVKPINDYLQSIGLPSKINYEMIRRAAPQLSHMVVEEIEGGKDRGHLKQSVDHLKAANEALKEGKIQSGEFLTEQEAEKEAYKMLFYCKQMFNEAERLGQSIYGKKDINTQITKSTEAIILCACFIVAGIGLVAAGGVIGSGLLVVPAGVTAAEAIAGSALLAAQGIAFGTIGSIGTAKAAGTLKEGQGKVQVEIDNTIEAIIKTNPEEESSWRGPGEIASNAERAALSLSKYIEKGPQQEQGR